MTARRIASTTSLAASKRIAARFAPRPTGATPTFTSGLSHLAGAPNAARDTRHATGFPCH